MAIYQITQDHLRPINERSFDICGVPERGDLQRLLRSQIKIISPDTLVIAEEFCEWEDSAGSQLWGCLKYPAGRGTRPWPE